VEVREKERRESGDANLKIGHCEGGLVGGGGGYGDAHVFEAGTGAAFFFGAGVASDDFAEFFDAGGFLA